jgi:Predicted membrane protein (DUF2078).
MFFDRHNDIAAWWPMGITMVIPLIIIAVAVWLVVRALSHGPAGSGESAEGLLRRRYAAGEIDEEEYAKRLEVLRRK